jgi:hypothetical protein
MRLYKGLSHLLIDHIHCLKTLSFDSPDPQNTKIVEVPKLHLVFKGMFVLS